MLSIVNIIIPIPNPISRDGHNSPPAYLTKLSTDFMYNQVDGNALNKIRIGYFTNQLYLTLPCSCKKDNIWPAIPYNIPKIKLFIT